MSNFWIQEVNKHREPDCEIMVIANKSDTAIDLVSDSDLRNFLDSNGVTLFKEVSAKTGDQVNDAFKLLG